MPLIYFFKKLSYYNKLSKFTYLMGTSEKDKIVASNSCFVLASKFATFIRTLERLHNATKFVSFRKRLVRFLNVE